MANGKTRVARDWIISKEGGALSECLRCGSRARLQLPIEISVWLAAQKAFLKAHDSCRQRSPIGEPATEAKDQPK